MSTALHIQPLDDLIEHETSDDCPCGPVSEPVKLADGSVGWIVVHASLDGRELAETGRTTPTEPV